MKTCFASTAFFAFLLFENIIQTHFTREDMYFKLNAQVCVRYLTFDGRYGCASSYKGVNAKLKYFENNEYDFVKSKGPIVALIRNSQLNLLYLQQLRNFFDLQAVLVLRHENDLPISHEAKQPFNHMKPPDSVDDFDWNPNGDSLIYQDLTFPILRLTYTDSIMLLNLPRNDTFWVKLKTEMISKKNSTECLKKDHCTPVGGNSVWSTFGNVNPKTYKFIVLSASMMSRSMFDFTPAGASTSVSGQAALMAIASAVYESQAFKEAMKKTKTALLYAVFHSEEHGLLGSNMFAEHMRFLQCTDKNVDGSCGTPLIDNLESFEALDIERIQAMIHLGQLSNIDRQGEKTDNVFVHTNNLASSEKFLSLIDNIKKTNDEMKAKVKFTNDTYAKNKHIPPSSVWPFMRIKKSFPAMVFSDHEREFINNQYYAENDVKLNKDQLRITATVLLKSLAAELGVAEDEMAKLSVTTDQINEALTCIKTNTCGTLQGINNSPYKQSDEKLYLYSKHKSADSRKIYDFLFSKTMVPEKEKSDYKMEEWVSQEGKVYKSMTFYHPAYDTSLQFKNGKWRSVNRKAQNQVLTASKTISDPVEIYIKETEKTVMFVFWSGIAVFLITTVASLAVMAIKKKKKIKLR